MNFFVPVKENISGVSPKYFDSQLQLRNLRVRIINSARSALSPE